MLRLVLAGQDYAAIKTKWTLGMVMRVNRAMDLQERVNAMAADAQRKAINGGHG